jgi:pimeloyl-ACP methyl ester carboxylesterase
MTETVRSRDGTEIAYDRIGAGPALIVIGGAFNTRRSPGILASLLSSHFEVFTYDRRGRGGSGDTQPYAVQREIEDLAALLGEVGSRGSRAAAVALAAQSAQLTDAALPTPFSGAVRPSPALEHDAGGPVELAQPVQLGQPIQTVQSDEVFVYGHSSGAILALEAAAHGLPISRLAVYEAPYTTDPEQPASILAPDGREEGAVKAALDAGDRALAAITFMKMTGMPDEVIEGMRQASYWPGMLAIAHTLAYDLALTGDGTVPVERLGAITAPTLVIDGGASPAWASRAGDAVAAAIPGARRLTLEGEDHGVDPEALAPFLIDFFTALGSA